MDISSIEQGWDEMEDTDGTEIATSLQKESKSRVLFFIIGLQVMILVCLIINMGATGYLIYRLHQPFTEGTTSIEESLPTDLNSSQGKTDLFEEIRIPFNERDNERLYALLDPLAQIEVPREEFDDSMLILYQMVGEIESGVYSHYNYQGNSNGKKWFVLYYRIHTEHGLMMLRVSVGQAGIEPYSVVGFRVDAD
jgi:hypothetical protein